MGAVYEGTVMLRALKSIKQQIMDLGLNLKRNKLVHPNQQQVNNYLPWAKCF